MDYWVYKGKWYPIEDLVAEYWVLIGVWTNDIYSLLEYTPSVTCISVRAEWLRQSGRAQSVKLHAPWWRITPCPASIPWFTLHFNFRSQFCCLSLLCWSLIVNKHSGVMANCDDTSEWVHWILAGIRIAMRWVMLLKSLLTFLLSVRKMPFSLY